MIVSIPFNSGLGYYDHVIGKYAQVYYVSIPFNSGLGYYTRWRWKQSVVRVSIPFNSGLGYYNRWLLVLVLASLNPF